MPTWEQQRAGERAKIDSEATDGLAGVSNSLAYRVHEIEKHFHGYERWFGAAASASGETHVADAINASIVEFQIDSANNAWGAWVQILGSSDTPVDSGAKFDLHRLVFTGVERFNSHHFVQIGAGTSGAASLTAGTYTEFVFESSTAKGTETPIDVMMGRQDAGTKVWARCLVNADTGTLDFFYGLHEYAG